MVVLFIKLKTNIFLNIGKNRSNTLNYNNFINKMTNIYKKENDSNKQDKKKIIKKDKK